MRVKDAIRHIIDSTGDIYGSGESESIAFIVLEFVGFPRKKIFADAEADIGEEKENFIREVAKELNKNRPIQYILGETEFYGIRLKVDGKVLIPRQETEELVQRILRETVKENPIILDLGTGSGCIAVSLAKNITTAKVYATDISSAALRIARENAELNNIDLTAIEDDILKTKLPENLRFDIIVSNPPYVRSSEKQFMHANVLDFEPAVALFVSDNDPLLFYRAIALLAFERLYGGGKVYVEINENFGPEVAELIREAGLHDVLIIPDIHEKDRFVSATKKKVVNNTHSTKP